MSKALNSSWGGYNPHFGFTTTTTGLLLTILLSISILLVQFSLSTDAVQVVYTPVQQAVYNRLLSINSIEELPQQEYYTLLFNLGSLKFDRFILGLSHPSPLVKQATLHTLQNIVQHNSPIPDQPQKDHPYSSALESLSLFFVTYHKNRPIHYDHADPSKPPQWSTDQTYSNRETELITIIQPIINIGSLDQIANLRHLAITTSKQLIEKFPGTTPTHIRLLQYLSGQDVFIGGVFYNGSQYSGNSRFINQQFLAKLIRLHVSSSYSDDYEALRQASAAVMDLYRSNGHAEGNGEMEMDNGLDVIDGDEGNSLTKTQITHHNTLTFDPTARSTRRRHVHTMQFDHNRHQSQSQSTTSTIPTSTTIFSQLNFIDPEIDRLFDEIITIVNSNEDMAILYECVFAMSQSKISTNHLNLLYSLVISPDYNTSYYALAGIKRIALLSAIPGTVYITHTNNNDNNKNSSASATTTNGIPQQSLKPHVSKYVQAVSQAELTTMINPSHGQLAIKILKHASSKHPNHYLQHFSSLAFDDVINEVKAQLQTWYSMASSRGLVVYKEQDNSQTTINDIKFRQRYNNLSSSIARGRLVDKYQQWKDNHGEASSSTSSVQQILYIAKRKTTNKSNHVGPSDDVLNKKKKKKKPALPFYSSTKTAPPAFNIDEPLHFETPTPTQLHTPPQLNQL